MRAEEFYEGNWILESRCYNEDLDPEVFFDEARTEQAQEICMFCPVRAQCYAFANKHHIDGVCGGKNSRSRMNLETRHNRYLKELEEQMRKLLQGA
jgi:hypothetical protein